MLLSTFLDFIFEDVNPAAEKIDKIKKRDLTGKSVKDVFPGVYEIRVYYAMVGFSVAIGADGGTFVRLGGLSVQANQGTYDGAVF